MKMAVGGERTWIFSLFVYYKNGFMGFYMGNIQPHQNKYLGCTSYTNQTNRKLVFLHKNIGIIAKFTLNVVGNMQK